MALPQPLHIFQKDLRHLLPETLVSILFIVAFAFTASYDVSQSQIGGLFPLIGLLLKILIPVTWLVVISRLIQDEPLVGDRQFWTSRPYHWAKLLAAKLLYLVVFVYLPFFLMQVFLLWHAGLYPAQALPDLLHNLLLLTVYIVMPIAVISAVTSSFVWVLLSVLGAVVYIVILSVVLFFVVLQYLTPPELEPVLYGVVILLPFLVLVYQYATRKTSQSRIALLAAPLIVVLIVIATPAAALIRAAYPVDTDKDAPKLAELPDQYRPKAPQPGRLAVQNKSVQIAIPFLVSGVDRESNYVVQGTEATIDAPGLHWVSRFAGNGFPPQALQLNAGSPYGVARVSVPTDVFNRAVAPATVHLSLAAQHFKADKPETWKATAGNFSVPGHGVCSLDKIDPLHMPAVCKYAFKSPELNLVSAKAKRGTCAADAPAIQARTRLEGKPAGLDFDPVVTVPMDFTVSNPQDPGGRPESLSLCPGTPLEFIEARPVAKVRLEVDEKLLLLNNFALRIQGDQQPQTAPRPQQGPTPQ